MKSSSHLISGFFTGFCAILLLFPGCSPSVSEEKKENSKKEISSTDSQDIILATIDGKPLLTYQEFQSFIDRIDDAQPGVKSKLAEQPQLEGQIFNGLVDQKIVEHWLDVSGISQSKEYQDTKQQCIELCMMQLAQQKFEESVIKEFEASESDARDYYEKNKKQFIKKQGGVKAKEVTFSDETAAKEFLSKAKAAPKNFDSLAQEAGKTVIDLGTVNKENKALDKAITSKLTTITKVPSIDLVKVGNEYHVINSTKKLDDEYEKFDEIKSIVKQIVDFDVIPQKMQDKMQKLKKDYKLTINKDYFSEKMSENDNDDGATISKNGNEIGAGFPQSA